MLNLKQIVILVHYLISFWMDRIYVWVGNIMWSALIKLFYITSSSIFEDFRESTLFTCLLWLTYQNLICFIFIPSLNLFCVDKAAINPSRNGCLHSGCSSIFGLQMRKECVIPWVCSVNIMQTCGYHHANRFGISIL